MRKYLEENQYYKETIEVLQKKSKVLFLLNKINQYKEVIQYSWKKINLKEIIRYEKRWRKLKRQYEKVNIYGIEFNSIGETIPRLFMHLRDEKKTDNIYHIILPIFPEGYKLDLCNKGIFEIFKEKISFMKESNLNFWIYACIFHSSSISVESFNKYYYREEKGVSIECGKAILPLSKRVESYGKKKLELMGIKGDYICIHARESKQKKLIYDNYPNTTVADVDVNTFKDACEYMYAQGYDIVRMGKYEKKACTIENVIDYSNYFYNELMDFYLAANCKFFVGSASGMTSISGFWGRPTLITNLNVLSYGYEALPYTDKDLYIPKKFYSRSKKRLLNLYEMIEITNKGDRYDEQYKKMKIDVIDNTNEEIMNATIEMNEKLNGTWDTTEEEKKLMKKYWGIVDLWKSEHETSLPRKKSGAIGYDMIPMPICYSYLKNNLYLLDVTF